MLTTYNVNDDVLRQYQTSKMGGNTHKYGSWWRGPYLIVSVIPKPVSDPFTKPRYTIRNLVTGKDYMVDVTHIRPFYFDPNYVTPLNTLMGMSRKGFLSTIFQTRMTNVG